VNGCSKVFEDVGMARGVEMDMSTG